MSGRLARSQLRIAIPAAVCVLIAVVAWLLWSRSATDLPPEATTLADVIDAVERGAPGAVARAKKLAEKERELSASSKKKKAVETLVKKCLDAKGQNCDKWEAEINKRMGERK